MCHSALPDWRLEKEIADRLHNPPISARHPSTSGPLNFDLTTSIPKKANRLFGDSKCGFLTIPDAEAAYAFLQSVSR